MEAQFDDDLRLLTNALRQETFRFILIGHNRYSLYKEIAARIESLYPIRTTVLRLTGKEYRQIADDITGVKDGIILIPDFGWLFQSGNEDTCVAFNQRRDAFARLNIAFVCFIEPNEFAQVPYKVPDWWSLRSLELDFHRDKLEEVGSFQPAYLEEMSSLGGQTKEEKQTEINRLLQQIDTIYSENDFLLASNLFQIGRIFYDLFDYTEANEYYQKSLTIFRKIGNTFEECILLNNISQIHDAIGNYDLALSYLQQSLALQDDIGDSDLEASILNNIGQIYYVWGDYNTALEYLERSLSLTQDKEKEGVTLSNIGNIYTHLGEYDKALEIFQHSLNIQIASRNLRGQGLALNNISQVYTSQGDYTNALACLHESLIIRQRIGDKKGIGSNLNNIGLIHYTYENYENALKYFQQSLEINQQIDNKSGMATALLNIGDLYLDWGQDIKRAISSLKRALELFKQLKSPSIKTVQKALDAIREQIGNERYNELIQSV
ncbi:tetratricopeptide repeat protein [Spirosoma sp. KUDC1026]|uniref:tetratricopeptide repeat protein n=1 Tax=Spirosoma sp. KUDC1026 TaxID=2745947 RepID=UPI00159BE590|nr:tetratricopeptide repeat protein [Spirosoma sp. KUDC1026]QKZ15053.1 tetratricopeptide repeat protein [Spirosoma sp. KUDC1026]